MDTIGRGALMLVVKIFLFGFLGIVLILFCRIGYSYSVANSSAEHMITQIARIVAEENCLNTETDALHPSGTTDYDRVKNMLDSISNEHSATLKYYTQSATDFKNNLSTTGGKITAIKVQKTGESSNLYKQKDSGSVTYSWAQRGELITITLTVYWRISDESVHNGIRFSSSSPADIWSSIEQPITKTITVPGIKYYRGA